MSGAAYRVEVASGGRAGCRATHCKKEGTKIAKGELRQGTLVTIEERSSFHWRHWGCVTPEVLKNWATKCEGDMELVDGWDALDEELQAKVQRAIEEMHVDDEDWNGDIEMNRLDPDGKKNRGMFVKTPKKKAKKTDTDDDDDAEASPTKKKAAKKPAKKRGRAADDDDIDDNDEPAPKKSKRKPKKAVKDEDEADDVDEAPKKPAKRGKKVKDSVVDEVEEAPAPKAKKGKQAKSAATIPDSDLTVEDEPAPTQKKARAKKVTAPVKQEDDEMADASPEPPKKRRGRPKKAAAEAS